MPISEQLLEDIKNNKIIDSIDFCNQNLNDKDIVKLVAALKHNADIKKLYLSNQNISDKGIIALAGVETIEVLDLSNSSADSIEGQVNQITAKGLIALANSNLKDLNIAGIRIEDGNIEPLALSQTLIELTAYDCNISKVEKLFEINKTIKKLDLSSNPIEDQEIETIASNTTLEELDLSDCLITQSSLEFVAQNESLITLHLSGNDLHGCSSSLAGHKKLKYLDISDCNIDDRIINFFADSTLDTLRAESNDITSLGIEQFPRNNTINTFDLSFNGLDAKGLEQLLYMPHLQYLFAMDNKINESAVEVIQEMFSRKEDSSIRCINLSGNKVSTELFVNKKRKVEPITEDSQPALKKFKINSL